MKDLLRYYQKLYQMTREQNEFIIKSDFDQLLKILDQKQKLIDKIDKINYDEYIKNYNNPKHALKLLKDLIQQIKELEDKNRKILRQKKEELGSKLADFNHKQKSRKGYQSTNNYEAKFIDKKS